jgi:hypothetical protein
MIPKDSGIVAPPSPWIVRATIISASEPARAAIRLPTAMAARTTRSTRFLPNMSPNRPATGVATEVASRKEVNTHVTPVAEVSRSRSRAGNAGTTSDCSSA